jgi:D-3-phosphoglycerate dehydrogenase
MLVLRLNAATFPLTDEEQTLFEANGIGVKACELPEEASGAFGEVTAIATVSAKVRADLMARMPNLAMIARYGAGTDNVDTEAATRGGIVVANVPDFCLSEMADHTMALLLAMARQLPAMDRATRTGQWLARVQVPTRRVAGKRLGLVGFGKIAQAVAVRAATFGLHVAAFDTAWTSDTASELGVVFSTIDEILATSDFVSLHVPLNAATHHLIGERELRRMKADAVLINTARGAVVDEGALVRALGEGWIAGAALDVYETLPMFDLHPPVMDHPLFHMDNVLLTPHTGGCSQESMKQLMREGSQAVVAALRGEWPAHIVNPEVQPRARLRGAARHA